MSVVVSDYGGSSGAVSVSVAEMEAIQLVMMCEGAGWDGVTVEGWGPQLLYHCKVRTGSVQSGSKVRRHCQGVVF